LSSSGRAGSGRGLTLLEVLVALVLLGLVLTGYLQLLHGAYSLLLGAREWNEAVGYAVDGMERSKLGPAAAAALPSERLPGGFRRQTTLQPWRAGLDLVTVTVVLPAGGRFDLYRLETSRARLP
jgi:prepilin-type N-terminal cleavage/methylation domain-containing protein